VGAALIYVADRYWDVLVAQVAILSPLDLAGAVIALVLGKAMIAVNGLHSVRSQGARMSYLSMLAISSVSQLGKYVPGSVLQFAGKGWMYSARGMGAAAIGRALVIENVWQWIAAATIGVVLILLSASVVPLRLSTLGVLSCVGALGVIALASRYFDTWCRSWIDTAAAGWWPSRAWMLMIPCLAWIMFGLSFAAIWPEPLDVSRIALAIGAFAIAALAGFLVPIAPAGLGVREVVIVATVVPVLATEQAISLAALSRAIWIVVEVVMAALSLVLLKSGRA